MRRFVFTLASLLGQAALGDGTSSAPSTDRWPSGLHLGVDYYPSHWAEWMWDGDMARMRAANLSFVRINEFDWAILEPAEGEYNFSLLDRSIDLIGRHGLKAIIGTPTAAPPQWASDKYDLDFVDVTNTTLIHGSRRHYSFSSPDYRTLSQAITVKLAERYGRHPAVVGWQLDNELGCHGTTRSYDANAIRRFRAWLRHKYGSVDALNDAQGRVFWSSQLPSFEAVQPPFLSVAAANVAHVLDWYRFSSDMVIEFAREQAAILRTLAPTQAVTTNFMMGFADFHHHDFAREVGIDLATMDQYPLAAPHELPWLTDQQRADALRTGLPDWQALHHALYRGVAGAAYGTTAGPFGVMEMQAGLLNWASNRLSPWSGMVRLWTLETFAEAGDLVSYFRWRQPPFAQEQTLSGLHTSDDADDVGSNEQQMVALQDLPLLREAMGSGAHAQADVALVYDYTSDWVWAIEPYSGTWNVRSTSYTDTALQYSHLVYAYYSALRRLGLSIDVIGPEQSLDGYRLVVVPSLPIVPDAFDRALATFVGPVVFGPHTGSKTAAFATVPGLNPGPGSLRDRLPMRVSRVETPPDYAGSGVVYADSHYPISRREEWISCARAGRSSSATISYTSPHRAGEPAACAQDKLHYLAFHAPPDLLVAYLGDVAAEANITALTGTPAGRDGDLGGSLRLARRGSLLWAFNYGTAAVAAPVLAGATLVLGTQGIIPVAGVSVWKLPQA